MGRSGRVGPAEGGRGIFGGQIGHQEFRQGQFHGAKLIGGQGRQGVGRGGEKARKYLTEGKVAAQAANAERQGRDQPVVEGDPWGADE